MGQGDLLGAGGLGVGPGEAGQVVLEQRRPSNRLSGRVREWRGRDSIRRLIEQFPQPRVLGPELLDFPSELLLRSVAVQLRLTTVGPGAAGLAIESTPI